jgi:hypothetical protein
MDEVRSLLNRAKQLANPKLIQKYATYPAAKIIRDDAKRRVRRGPGVDTKGNPRKHLEEEIFAARGHGRDGSSIAGVDYAKAPHAHLVEGVEGKALGTKPHIIRPKKRGRMLWIKKLRLRLPFVHHPGSQKRPFLRPAVRASKQAVAKRLEHGLRRLIYDLTRRRTIDL